MRFQLSSDIAEGMRFLHSLKLMHRDLKSPNVLLKTEGRRIVAKIADFGLAKELESIVPGEVTDISNPTWLAPEVLSGHRPTLKVLFFFVFCFLFFVFCFFFVFFYYYYFIIIFLFYYFYYLFF